MTLTNSANITLPIFVGGTTEIQEIVDRSSSELEVLTNMLALALDLLSEQDCSELPSSESNREHTGEGRRNPARDRYQQ